MIINISDVWEKACRQHYVFLNTLIDNALMSLSFSFLDIAIKNFLENNRYIIVSGSPSELTDCISDYEERFGKGLLHNCASQKLAAFFNFDDFSRKSNKKWSAFKLCSLAKYKVCCYCHMVGTGTNLPNEDEKGYRPPIDHYYTKSDYPFLALTLSNFIPCCEKCNGSQMKHSINFAVERHLNPMLDVESIEFELRPLVYDGESIANILTLQLPPASYSLQVVARLNLDMSSNSIKTFQLKTRYKDYSTQAFYLAKRARGFLARKTMLDSELDFTTEINDLLEFDPQEYKNIVYGKARICIAKQFGAIDD